MEIIRINDKKLDVCLEKEKTVGDVLSGLEQWLGSSGHRLSALSVDGQAIGISMMEEAFARKIDTVKHLDMYTDLITDLAAESLERLLEDIKEYESLDFEEKSKFLNKWKERACAKFIYDEAGDLYSLCVNAFSGSDINSRTLFSITEERLREIKNPAQEFAKIEPLVDEICERLIRLPLDIQTGKDALASGTIQVFSGITEKIFRIFKQFDSQWYFSETQEKESLARQLTEFGNILKELLEAYEKNDLVLVGDLSEYETSPKLKDLYFTIKNNVQTQGKK